MAAQRPPIAQLGKSKLQIQKLHQFVIQSAGFIISLIVTRSNSDDRIHIHFIYQFSKTFSSVFSFKFQDKKNQII